MMDKFTEYLLGKINEYKEDAESEADAKEMCDAVRVELLQVLVEYQNSLGVV
jgi:hypothetical protein